LNIRSLIIHFLFIGPNLDHCLAFGASIPGTGPHLPAKTQVIKLPESEVGFRALSAKSYTICGN
jgi:hypothetical protein